MKYMGNCFNVSADTSSGEGSLGKVVSGGHGCAAIIDHDLSGLTKAVEVVIRLYNERQLLSLSQKKLDLLLVSSLGLVVDAGKRIETQVDSAALSRLRISSPKPTSVSTRVLKLNVKTTADAASSTKCDSQSAQCGARMSPEASDSASCRSLSLFDLSSSSVLLQLDPCGQGLVQDQSEGLGHCLSATKLREELQHNKQWQDVILKAVSSWGAGMHQVLNMKDGRLLPLTVVQWQYI